MTNHKTIALDTTAYSCLMRGKEETLWLVDGADTVAMPIIVVAELRAGFAHMGGWPKQEVLLDSFMNKSCSTVLHVTGATVPIYAELYAYSRAHGKQLSQNDLWIAALCIQYNYPLLTYDKDFDALPQLRRISV